MTSTPATLIGKLNTLGYDLYLDGDKVKYRYTLPGDPPAGKVKPLLDELRNNKEDVITHLKFKDEFNKIAEHLRQRDYPSENFAKLQKLSYEMNRAWNEMDYPAFKKILTEMVSIPGILRPEGGRPQAAKIYSHILGEEVWVCNSPEAMSLCPEGG